MKSRRNRLKSGNNQAFIGAEVENWEPLELLLKDGCARTVKYEKPLSRLHVPNFPDFYTIPLMTRCVDWGILAVGFRNTDRRENLVLVHDLRQRQQLIFVNEFVVATPSAAIQVFVVCAADAKSFCRNVLNVNTLVNRNLGRLIDDPLPLLCVEILLGVFSEERLGNVGIPNPIGGIADF